MNYSQMSADELFGELRKAEAEYAALKEKKLSLDLSRGKPGRAQLDILNDMINCITPEDLTA